jgi:hypothetical protein
MTRRATVEPSPTEEDIVTWSVLGMELDGFTSANRHLQAAITTMAARGFCCQVMEPGGKTVKSESINVFVSYSHADTSLVAGDLRHQLLEPPSLPFYD